jgi:chromosome segregation ATPase
MIVKWLDASGRPMMPRFVKSILVRIPAVRRYLEDKRSIAAALQASISERDHLVAEVSYLRATGEILTTERDSARGEVEQIGATARFLGAARDAALDEVKQSHAAVTRLVAELDELKEVRQALVGAATERDRALDEVKQSHAELAGLVTELKESGAALVNAGAERDRALREIKQTQDTLDGVLRDRDVRIEEIKQLLEAADAAAANRLLCQVTISELQKTQADLTLETEILRASLARAIVENDRLRLGVAGGHPTRDQGDSR